MANVSVWQRPRLRDDESELREHRTTWLELFYDLVFVVVVAQLAHELAAHVSWEGLLAFVMLFIPVWWVWIGATFYNDRFDTDDVGQRVYTFLQILAVAALALSVHDGLGEASQAFALSYAAARLLIIFMWVRGGFYNPVARPLTNRYAMGFSVSLALWTLSVFVSPPWRFVMWGVGLLFDLLTPLVTLQIQRRLPSYSTSHLPERFGLFTIIVLGESVAGTLRGAAAGEGPSLALQPIVAGALGLAMAFALWWLYFDNVMDRPVRPGLFSFAGRTYLHLLLLMGITAIGAGVADVIASESNTLEAPLRWLICGAVGVSLIALGLMEVTLAPGSLSGGARRATIVLRLATGVAALLLALAGEGLSMLVLMGVLVLLLMLPIFQGLFSRIGRGTGVASGPPAEMLD
ncbi:MAG TPA: low temperature requirement protein A [Chloroflexia bacterium]|nr:low temperature requirement protein A [Chloroflexia bacterium]